MPKANTPKIPPEERTRIKKPRNTFIIFKVEKSPDVKKLGASGAGVPQSVVEQARTEIEEKHRGKQNLEGKKGGKSELVPQNLPLYHAPQEAWARANSANINSLMGVWWNHLKDTNPEEVKRYKSLAAMEKDEHERTHLGYKETRKPRMKKTPGAVPTRTRVGHPREISLESSSYGAPEATLSRAAGQTPSVATKWHDGSVDLTHPTIMSHSRASAVAFPVPEIPDIVPRSRSNFAPGSSMEQYMSVNPLSQTDHTAWMAMEYEPEASGLDGECSAEGSWHPGSMPGQIPMPLEPGNASYGANFMGTAPQTIGLTFSQPQVALSSYGVQPSGYTQEHGGNGLMAPTNQAFQPWALQQGWFNPPGDRLDGFMDQGNGGNFPLIPGPSRAPEIVSDRKDPGDWNKSLTYSAQYASHDTTLHPSFTFDDGQHKFPTQLTLPDTLKMCPSHVFKANQRWEGDHLTLERMMHGDVDLELCDSLN